MKGVIFNLLEDVVVEAHGDEFWESLLDDTGLDGVYTAVGTYAHQDLIALAEAAGKRLGAQRDDVVRWFGTQALARLATRYPAFFEPHTRVKDFLLTLNDVIHPEVRKLFPGAYAPEFTFVEVRPGVLEMAYDSHRGLCSFAEGLLDGTAAHFNDPFEFEQVQCTKRGDDRCMFRCTFG